ncbi:hypothetical protein Hanom_Chr07g00624921 [Helianthus anomalus]
MNTCSPQIDGEEVQLTLLDLQSPNPNAFKHSDLVKDKEGVGDLMVSLISPSNPVFRVLLDLNYTPTSQVAPTSRNSPMILMMVCFEG